MPRKQNIEVEYVKSVHIVSRWVHEIFERPEVRPDDASLASTTTTESDAASVAA